MARFLPKSLVCLREGYNRQALFADLVAGVTVGIIALPLAMAFGIGSIPQQVAAEAGISPPAMGLYTAVVAGFLISLLGGSRVQIGGPTGAFIVIVYGIASRHGYAGLTTATLMASVIIIIMGIARLGAVIKFIPYPVTTGFTSGIAVIIFSSQIKDLFGLQMPEVPADFVEKWRAFVEHAGTWSGAALGVSLGTLGILIAMRKLAPRLPAAIVAVIITSAVVWAFGLPVETIGSKFGGIPRSLPAPHLPELSWTLIKDLIPDATTIAILAAIESLLSAVVADGMTGGRHKADCELVAQGVANIASVIFGGIPATGAIARTTANIKSGAKTPLAGMIHAVTLLIVMIAAAPLAAAIPLPTLAGVLVIVAWNMSERDHFRTLLKAPPSDRAVLLTTFALTVFLDLTVAVGIGMVLASLLFIKRMADLSDVSSITREFANSEDDAEAAADPEAISKRLVPSGVEVYEIDGPFFFGVADRLKDVLQGLEKPPYVFILRLRKVPYIDATGMHALKEFYTKCHRQGTTLLLSGVRPSLRETFARLGFEDTIGGDNILPNIDEALTRADHLLALRAWVHVAKP